MTCGACCPRRNAGNNEEGTIGEARPLAGRRALITGSALRLGRAIATGLAEAGADIVIHYRRSREEAEEAAAAVADRGVVVELVQADLADPEAAEMLIDRAWETAGPLDMLVNNASRFPSDRLDSLRFDGLIDVLAINSWTPFVLTRSLAARIRAAPTEAAATEPPDGNRRGAVVNLLDTRIVGGDPAHAAYHLSKRMLADLTRMTAVEYAPDIRVNAVAPGYILPPPGADRTYLEERARAVPAGRPGSAADVADAVVYLMCSDYVTGETIFVDGGQNLAPERATT
jgi:NAD(P)-dependent dehydrogenase (short-subunit alcohol dehydrogenase family)